MPPSDLAREGQRHDAARQRADIGIHPARPRLRGKGRFHQCPADFADTLDSVASHAASKANQATAKVRLSLLTDAPRRRRLEGSALDQTAIQKTTGDFLRDAARAQIAIVYCTGHGVRIDGRKYLVRVDVQLTAGRNITDGTIDMVTILAGVDDQVRTNILILDACRNNQLEQRVASAGPEPGHRSGSGPAAPTVLGAGATLGAGTLIAFATAPGEVALDGEGANSPFSAALSRHIGTPRIEVQQMLTRVRAEVVAMTRGKQVPWVEFLTARRGLWRRS
jgi:hypothetical protein